VSGEVNRNDRRNSDYHSVGTGYGIENENEGVAGDDRYLPSHYHDASAVGDGNVGRHRGRLDKWVSVDRNDVSEKMLVKMGSHLTIDTTIVDVKYVR
jgi:hypothetical protein